MFGHGRALPLLVLSGLILLFFAGRGALAPSSLQAAQTSETPECPATTFDEDRFSGKSTRINNEYLPLIPGTKLVLQGVADRGQGPIHHQVELVVTDLTKVIDGVRTLVLWDQDFQEGVLAEAELAFHAQDRRGNVWNLGEYPEEYEDGEFIGAPNTWIAGVGEARAGVAMRADPEPDEPSYLQAFAPEVIWDCGEVVEEDQEVCGPLKCYDDVVIVDEWSPADPEGGHQVKYHSPRVGVVQISAVDDPEGETLELIKVRKLSAGDMKKARDSALKLEQRAYEISEEYGETPPMERLRGFNRDRDDDDDDDDDD
jgi:hypothetical protein